MADNFDFKKFLVENKLGPYSKVKRLNESAIKTALLNQINDEGISDADFIDMLDQAGYEENWAGDIAATIDGLSDNQARELYTIYSEEDDETAGFGSAAGPMYEAYLPSNIKEFAKRKGVSSLVSKVAKWAEKAGKSITGGTAIGKNYSTLVLDLKRQGGEIHINTDDETITVNDTQVRDYNSFIKALEG
jgi:hypothetical protein